MNKRYILLGLFLAGILLGYFGAYIVYFNEVNFGAEYSRYRFDFFAYPALPGMVVDRFHIGWDYRLTEQWIVGRRRIAVANGGCYLGAGIVFMLAKWAFVRIVARN